MVLLTTPSNITLQNYPCPNCEFATPVDVITRIDSEEALSSYVARNLNRAGGTGCGAQVEAPDRVSVSRAD